jgi:hypothetical protein
VAARVPREHREIGKLELVGQMRHAARMLVAAVEDDDRATRRGGGRRPVAVEQLDAVMGVKGLLFDGAHGDSGQ